METPFVTIIMPIRNEEEYIENILNDIFQQKYPQSKIEIIIADGMSSDKSVEIIEELKEKYGNLILISNYEKFIPSGLNSALNHSIGDFIIRVDGHSSIPNDYISTCIDIYRVRKNEERMVFKGVDC